MTRSALYINGSLESFGQAWVHIQAVNTASCLPYCIRIVLEDIHFVIDPVDKEDSVSWDEYLREEVNEGGSFMLSIYIEKLRQLSEVDIQQPRWVIATLDSVTEDAHGIELHGRVVEFDPARFLR